MNTNRAAVALEAMALVVACAALALGLKTDARVERISVDISKAHEAAGIVAREMHDARAEVREFGGTILSAQDTFKRLANRPPQVCELASMQAELVSIRSQLERLGHRQAPLDQAGEAMPAVTVVRPEERTN